jgi:S-adenosylmethionine:tRNA ribosyltransferase-isomerase
VAVSGSAPPLPLNLRASLPPELRGLRRDHVRLLVADRQSGGLTHTRFDRIGDHLRPGDVLVVNRSRTLPAAVPAIRDDGTIVQLRPCVRRAGTWDALSVEPQPPHANVPLNDGETLVVGRSVIAQVLGRRSDIPLLWRMRLDGDGVEELLRLGEPIRYSYVPSRVPVDYYQTVFADRPGSAEMPSAGRPFSWELLDSLQANGVRRADLVLHTGLSSYQDDDVDAEHLLYEEWFEVPAATAAAVNSAARVIAVGTTVVRALETVANDDGHVHAGHGWTRLRISPNSRLRSVDGLLTGMHEPQASHFELLGAFLSEEQLLRAYTEAVDRGYLWHEFGDTMLIL